MGFVYYFIPSYLSNYKMIFYKCLLLNLALKKEKRIELFLDKRFIHPFSFY